MGDPHAMTIRKLSLLAAALGLLLATGAAADDHQTQTSGSGSMSSMGSAEKAQEPKLGHKTWKERINTVARKPLNHDVEWLDGNDRSEWNGHTVWQGIRDERPLVARKTMGFHDPRPHRPRAERVLLISRGPIQGPGFAE
jgi:hypothetical protein